jgi:CheY-like chemotaxis protein
LPRSATLAQRPGTALAGHNTPALAGGGKVLLVDDDSAVREVTGAMLRDLGYIVLEAGSGGGAFDLLDRERLIDLIVVDFAMPGINGAEVARQARMSRPGIPILFITGFADRAAIAGVDGAQIIGKPFSRDELADKVAQVLATPSRCVSA